MQLSIGMNQDPEPDVNGALSQSIDLVNAMPQTPGRSGTGPAEGGRGGAAEDAGHHQRLGRAASARSRRAMRGASDRLSAWEPFTRGHGRIDGLLRAARLLRAGRRAADPAPATIMVAKDFMLRPASVTVGAGSTVTWTNKDDEPHRVVGDCGLFRSGAMDTNGSFPFRFATPGTCRFFCSILAQGWNDRRARSAPARPPRQRSLGKRDCRLSTTLCHDFNTLRFRRQLQVGPAARSVAATSDRAARRGDFQHVTDRSKARVRVLTGV